MGRAYCVLFFAFLAVACGTPEPIKALSAQQVSAQSDLRSALDQSFARMEAVATGLVEDVATDIQQTNRDTLMKGGALLQSGEGGYTAERFADFALEQFKARDDALREAYTHLDALRRAHENVLRSCDQLIEAQKTLDEYLRLEQTDERAVNELLASVGIARKDIEHWTDEGLSALSGVTSVLSELS
jgi:hypothetical protein